MRGVDVLAREEGERRREKKRAKKLFCVFFAGVPSLHEQQSSRGGHPGVTHTRNGQQDHSRQNFFPSFSLQPSGGATV